jgi:hypothetical protein
LSQRRCPSSIDPWEEERYIIDRSIFRDAYFLFSSIDPPLSRFIMIYNMPTLSGGVVATKMHKGWHVGELTGDGRHRCFWRSDRIEVCAYDFFYGFNCKLAYRPLICYIFVRWE